MINREIERVNSHVFACLEVLESTLPASDIELLRCSSECGSLIAFIHSNRNGLREVASDFDEKMRSATWERCTRVNMQMIETAPFCTSLLERTLNAQARLKESVRQQQGVDYCSLRRLLTEVYEEASAGLSDDESPSVSDLRPKRTSARSCPRCRLPKVLCPALAFSASRRSRRVHRGRGSPTCPRWRFRRPPRTASSPTTPRARCSFSAESRGCVDLSTLTSVLFS